MSNNAHVGELIKGWLKRQSALDEKAENARELGLDYEPTVMDFAREAGAIEMRDNDSMGWGCEFELHQLEAFAALIRADERNKTWTPSEWTEYERSIAAQEREACVKAIKAQIRWDMDDPESTAIEAIRARGTT